MKVDDTALRRELIATVRTANQKGINHGTSGNASVRCGSNVLITPSGIAYDKLDESDIVLLDLDGAIVQAAPERRPSSEWRFHVDILRTRVDAAAVLHTHGRAVTTLACLQRGIPAFHYMIAVTGGDSVRCAEYATFGTQALSDLAIGALRGRRACLLANHGAIVLGESLAQALAIAEELEQLADVYWRCLQIGEPTLLTKAEMDAVRVQFASGYGSGGALEC